MFQGHVYDKKSGTPLVNIPVSDGRNTVLTDENGAYSLDGWERAHWICVCALTYAQDDWYHLLEEGQETYDFSVSLAQTDGTHTFLHFSDTELNESGAGSWLDFVKDFIHADQPDFLIQTGDIFGAVGMPLHIAAMNSDNMGLPVRYTLGNHDYVKEKAYGEYVFESLFGPSWYSFDYGAVHYVILPIRYGDAPSGYEKADSYRWLKQDLALADPSKKVIVFCHDLCSESEDDFILSVDGESYDLKAHNLLAWVFGHLHTQYANKVGDAYNIGSANPSFAGVDSSPTAMRTVTIDAEGVLSSRLIYRDLKTDRKEDRYAWRATLEGNVLFGKPIESDGKIYVATSDDGWPKVCSIYCLDATDGKILWETPTAHGVKNAMILSEGKLYALDAMGELLCLDASDGAVIYTAELDFHLPHHSVSSMLLEDGVIYTQSSCDLCIAVNAETGGILWKSEKVVPSGGGLCPADLISFEDMIIVSKQWRGILAFRKSDGSFVWKSTASVWRNSSPALVDGKIFATYGDGVCEIDARSGETLRTQSYAGANFPATGTPVLRDGYWYVPSVSHGIVKICAETLAWVGNFPAEKPMVAGSHYSTHDDCASEPTPIVRDDMLIYMSSDGYLRFADIETTEIRKNIFVGAPSFADPIELGDRVIVADLAGRVTAYDM